MNNRISGYYGGHKNNPICEGPIEAEPTTSKYVHKVGNVIVNDKEVDVCGMFSDSVILEKMKAGDIVIIPYDPKRLNGASYNVTLAPVLKVYTDEVLDMNKENPTKDIVIPEEGYVLEPGELYIGSTNEWTEVSDDIMPFLDGRSSIGRLGIDVHITAGQGDPGFKGKWTLEIRCVKPVRIYANKEIGQLVYHHICGPVINPYRGKYYKQDEPVASRMYLDELDPENKGYQVPKKEV